MRIFLINLDRSPERLAFMTTQLAALGLSAERLSAVDGATIDLQPYATSGLTKGEIGCFLSHRDAWQRLVASDNDLALVLEDDVRLSADLPRVLETAAKLDRGNHILKLDTSGRAVLLEKRALRPSERIRLSRLHSEHTGTAGYVISAQAAAELLSRSSTIAEPVDLFMFGRSAVAHQRTRIFQAVPAVVAQEKRFRAVQGTAMGSVIKPQGRRSKPFASKVVQELRRWLRKLRTNAAHLPSRIKGERIYLRVPFA